jgi:hypothetical protein
MAEILQFQKHIGDITVPYDREAVLKAFHWLKKNISIIIYGSIRNTMLTFQQPP